VVDIEDGNGVMRIRLGKYGVALPPVIYKNVLYQETRYGDLYALTLEGKEIWRFRTSEVMGYPLIYKDRIYIGSGDNNFYCLSLDGKEIWRFKTGGYTWFSTVWNDRVYVGSHDCHLYCLDLDGREIWRFTTSSTTPAWVPPTFEAWETEIKTPVSKEEIRDEKKSYLPSTFGQELFESVYRTQSEYKTESPYKQKRRNY
jgi:hypothetical protein